MNKLKDDYLLFQIIQYIATLDKVSLVFFFLICALVYKRFNYSDLFRNIPTLRTGCMRERIFMLRKKGKHNKKFIRSLSLFIKLIVKSFIVCTNLLHIKQI